MNTWIVGGISGGFYGSRINGLIHLPTVTSDGFNALSNIFSRNISFSNLYTAGSAALTLATLPDLAQKLYYNKNSERILALGAFTGYVFLDPIPLFWEMSISGAFMGAALMGLTLATVFEASKPTALIRANSQKLKIKA
jgi:hypothetical protein